MNRFVMLCFDRIERAKGKILGGAEGKAWERCVDMLKHAAEEMDVIPE